ncbi:nucleotide exchange factor GrpE [Candidatus Magnetomonas plexicatena]|uniref:nucleotide exchange factor GrpE n=1 Tax=Candidatus Magnetomonas plexicatena TaxID=2552947 RepID=UPI001C751A01|nr:nucleotide exchange factor GrpE [Nitrospirales bacterium LBB_01]
MEEKTIDITVGDDGVKSANTEQASDAEFMPDAKSQLDELEKLRVDNAELKDKYIRLHAEFDNYRKRVQKEKDEIYKYGAEPMVSDLLNVIDNLEAALSHVTDMTNPLAQGIDLTLKELKKILSKYGLLEIDAAGKAFDPAYHHAMTEVQRDDLYDKTVVDVFRKGYTYKERVLRASMVSVSKSAGVQDDIEDTSESKEEKTEFNDIKEGNNG